jgi:tripeptidyl-peptidase I
MPYLDTMRLFFASVCVSSLLIPALGLPSASFQNKHVIHEKRDDIRSRWVQSSGLDQDHIIPARIGLTQKNLELGAEYLYEM